MESLLLCLKLSWVFPALEADRLPGEQGTVSSLRPWGQQARRPCRGDRRRQGDRDRAAPAFAKVLTTKAT